MDFGAALMGMLVVVVVKCVVMVFAARLLLRLCRVSLVKAPRKLWLAIPKEERHRFRALTWGLIFFGVSELVCGIEIYILTRASLVLACIHAVLSAIAMGLTAFGLFQLLDWKYFHLVDTGSSCIAANTCGTCTKRTEGRCQFRAALLITAVLLFFMAIPVFFAPTERLNADPRPYALPFASWNRWYDDAVVPWLNEHLPNVATDGSAFYLPEGMFILEYRILPATAMILAAFSVACLLKGKDDRGIMVLLICFGTLAYAYFEVVIYGVTGDAYFGALTHEVGEFFFLILLSDVLMRMFAAPVDRKGLDGPGDL